jgi:hypothetical protein
VIQSEEGWLFGGFTTESWKDVPVKADELSFKADESAFLFTLTNPHSIPPTRYTISSLERAQCAIYVHPKLSAAFGYFDISIESNANKCYSCIDFPSIYKDTTNKGSSTFTGESQFRTKEIEVYAVVTN